MKRKGDYFQRKKRVFLILILSTVFFACGDGDKVAKEISKTTVDLKISRFDRAFAQASPSDIPDLKHTYPYLFPEKYADSVWEAKLVDTLQLELLEEVDKAFTDFKEETADLEQLFKHIKYYFPNYKVPNVLTVITDVDYNNRVILTDSLLFLGLDNYLGHEHKFYAGMQNYIAVGLDKKFLISDVASTFGKQVVSRPRDKTLLAKMVYYGKELYLKDKITPFLEDAEKIGYSPDELAWAQANEEQIWRYFVARELLYSTNNRLDQRFLDLAPFSKFQLELDNESPGRIGRYMGWQIVRSFMENNDLSLTQLLNLSADEIFKRSNYKPKK